MSLLDAAAAPAAPAVKDPDPGFGSGLAIDGLPAAREHCAPGSSECEREQAEMLRALDQATRKARGLDQSAVMAREGAPALGDLCADYQTVTACTLDARRRCTWLLRGAVCVDRRDDIGAAEATILRVRAEATAERGERYRRT